MRLTNDDIEWMESAYPSLQYRQQAQQITGELDFCARYDAPSGKVQIKDFERDDFIRESNDTISDVFEIEIRLDPESIGSNGWPKVYEVGGRVRSIADKWNIAPVDLHLYKDDACCLGIRYSQERNLTLHLFINDLVIPFFYRLSYVDCFGLEAARRDLWGEYSHGDDGLREHESEMLDIARRSTGPNKACPCGSGSKYEICCLDEVQAVKDPGPDPGISRSVIGLPRGATRSNK